MRRLLLFVGLVLLTSIQSQAQKLFGGNFVRKPSQTLATQPYSYRLACTFYADLAGRDSLPAQMRFFIIRKRDNVVVKEFLAAKSTNPEKNTIYNDCVPTGATPHKEYYTVAYEYETLMKPTEYIDDLGYYVVNEAPNVLRAPNANVKSSKMLLYHWFSPQYLSAFMDNADLGLATTGIEGAFAYLCKDEGKALNFQLNAWPTIRVFDPQALDITARRGVPLTDGRWPFQEAGWNSGFNSTSQHGGELTVSDSKPKFDNISETTQFEVWTIPRQIGVFSMAFVMEQTRNGIKVAENSLEIYAEVNDCKKVSYVTLNITDAATNKPATLAFCKENPIQLSANTIQTDVEFQWYKNGNPIAGATSSKLVVTETGKYFLKSKRPGSCSEATTNTMNAQVINCQNIKNPEILGANLHDLTKTTVPSDGKFINQHSLRAIYYTSTDEVVKMPSAVRTTVYRKRDNQPVEELTLNRNNLAEVTNLLERLCDKGIDTIISVTYDGSIKFKPETYNDDQGYYMLTEPICCRADADNLARNGSSIVNSMDIGKANQVQSNPTIQRGHTIDLFIPFTIKTCVNQPVRVFLYAGNRENITAQFAGFTDVLEGENMAANGRTMTWGYGYEANNFNANVNRLAVESRRNGQLVIVGIPEKPGVFVYRMKINGLMNGKVYSTVYQEFRLQVDDCTPAPKPTIFSSKVARPHIPVSNEPCQDSLVQLNLRNYRTWGKYQWYFHSAAIPNATDSILVVPKNQSGYYKCTVRMPRHCPEYISTDPFSINYQPRPSISLTGKTNGLCQGQIVPLTAQTDAKGAIFDWNLDNKTQVINGQNIFSATKLGTYIVTVQDAKGCMNTSQPYTLVSSSLPNSSISAARDYICEGNNQLTLSTMEGAAYSYEWTRNGQPIINNKSQLAITEFGNYNVKISDDYGCNTSTQPFVIRQLTKPTASVIAPSSDFCEGTKLTLRAQTNAQSPKYEWFNDNKVIHATTDNLTVAEIGAYAVKITDAFGCVNLSSAAKLSMNPLPKAQIVAQRTIVCEGLNMDILAATGEGYEYEWSKDGKRIANPSPILNVSETGLYSLKVTTVANCSKNADAVKIQQVKNPEVSVTAPTNRVCEGTPLILAAISPTARQYEWTLNGQIISDNNKATFDVKQTGEYGVKVTDGNNCISTAAGFKAQVIAKIKVVMDSIPSFCGFAFDPVPVYVSPQSGTLSGNGVVNGTFAPRVAGVGTHTVTYTVKGDLDCLSGEAKRTVSVVSAPPIDLGPSLEIYRGTSTKLNADMGKNYTYQWSPPTWINDVSSSKPIVSPDNTGYYTVRALRSDNCASEASIFIKVMQRIIVPDAFSPNGDGINDTWKIIGLEEYPEAEVTIFDRWGVIVFYGKGSQQQPFDGTKQGISLLAGSYTFIIRDKPGGNTFTGSVMILR